MTTPGPERRTAEPPEPERRAAAAVAGSGVPYRIVRHAPVDSLAQAAAARGLDPSDVVKTIVVRRAADDYLFVLVPGGRTISWPRLRALLGVHRMSLPDAATARDVTGYERGTITPFGSLHAWPVVADSRVVGRTVSVGGGGHGVGIVLAGDDLVAVLGATVADVTDQQPPGERDGNLGDSAPVVPG